MRSIGVASAVAGLIASSVASKVDPIVIKGSKFFYQNKGSQFFIKGIAYQQDYTGPTAVAGSSAKGGYSDPLADSAGCKRDLPYLKQLYTNTLRVYAVDPTANHDDCMNLFAENGIYVIADLSAPASGQSIDSYDPHWNDDLYARYVSVVDTMQKYDNVLGFFAGNEVAVAPNSTSSAAFVKAAVRDMKAYIKQKGYRQIGVGYAANDNQYIRVDLADYFNCGDQTDAIDFYGYNVYSWCGQSTYQESGYQTRTNEFKGYSVPAFFAEYGCNTVQPRKFTEVAALYGPQMTPTWSGGIVYMYFQEANDFGLVSVTGNNVKTLSDFNYLKQELGKINPSSVQMDSYKPSNSPTTCPKEDKQWHAAATPLPPSPNAQLCECMYDSLNCAVADSLSPKKYNSLFGYVCGKDPKACAGIAAKGQSGTYGAYGMCNPKEQLGFVFNQWWQNNGKSSSACSFKGAAQLQNPKSAGGSCQKLIQQAGKGGTGTVTSSPSGTGSSSGGGGSSKSSGAASAVTVPKMETGLLPTAFTVLLAALSGMGVVLI